MNITKAQVLALAVKRYMQGNREDPKETFIRLFSKDNLDSSMYRYFIELCKDIDNGKKIDLLEKISKNIEKEKEEKLIKETTQEYFKQNKSDSLKTRWQDVFTIIESKMIVGGNRKSSISDKRYRVATIFSLANSDYLEDISVFNAAEIKMKLVTMPKRNQANRKDIVSVETVQSYILAVNQVFEVAIEEGLIDYNPFKNLKVHKTKQQLKENYSNKYRPFSSIELKKIFNPKTYPSINEKDKFYIPLIALLQGMRLNEICQLKVNDIKKMSRTKYYISINEDVKHDQRTKNNTSNRDIPIHPLLIDLGFLDWIKERKQKDRNGRLFKSCVKDNRGYYSRDASKNFGNMLNRLGITDSTKVFHSFRHTFRVNCANAKISTELSNALGGWSGKTVGENYANEFSLRDKLKALKQIKVPELKALIKHVKL